MSASAGGINLWTDRKIPFVFEADYPHESDVLDAMRQWEDSAGVWFSARGNEANYIVVRNTTGTSLSPIGMHGGPQDVFIGDGYKAAHELGHTLGLLHEQQRSDRDAFVDMQWNNIIYSQSNGDFALEPNSINLSPYDRLSVMHYPAPATGWGGNPPDKEVWTMRWKADRETELGPPSWVKLSDGDKSGSYELYRKVPGWGNQAQGPNGGTSDAPRVAVLAGNVWMVWKGSGDDRIWYSVYDGSSWSPQTAIDGVGTSCAPAVAVLDGRLYAAWRGVGGDAAIWWATNDGSGWSSQSLVPGPGTSHGPALASFGGRLWLAWKGSGDDGIWFTTYDGSWAGQARVDGVATSTGPALGAVGNALYLAWRGYGNDSGIWLASTMGGAWSGQSKMPSGGTSATPALAEFDNRLWMCWRGHGDDGIWWANYTSAGGWTGQARISGVGTADSPALVGVPGKLRLCWAGVGHQGLYQAAYPETR